MIRFTNSEGVIKTLPAKIADGNGSVVWAWDVKTADFTSDDWKITAVASSNGQDLSSEDPLPLKVRP